MPVGSTLMNYASGYTVASTSTTMYLDNVVYENWVLSEVPYTDGILIRTNSGTETTPVFKRNYYIKDHLGNVRVVFDENGIINQVNHYYPFGMEYGESAEDQTEVKYQDYLFGGKEFDRKYEINMYDFKARGYDQTSGRFTTPDPLAEKNYSISPYAYCANNPVRYFDPDGRFKMDANQAQQYKRLAEYLKNNIQEIANNPKIMASLMTYGQFSKQNIIKDLEWGKGPTVRMKPLKKGSYGSFNYGVKSDVLNINQDYMSQLQKAVGRERDALLFCIAVSILHEYTHYGDDQDGIDYSGLVGEGEEGDAFEITAYNQLVTMKNARTILDQWEQQQEENNKKEEGLNNMIKNYNKLQSGRYEWNRYLWILVK